MDILYVANPDQHSEQTCRMIRSWGLGATVSVIGWNEAAAPRRQSFDLALLDLGTCTAAGAESVAAFRCAWPHLPVVVMTEAACPQQEAAIRALGVVYYLIKPYDMRNLEAVVGHLARRRLADANAPRTPMAFSDPDPGLLAT